MSLVTLRTQRLKRTPDAPQVSVRFILRTTDGILVRSKVIPVPLRGGRLMPDEKDITTVLDDYVRQTGWEVVEYTITNTMCTVIMVTIRWR